MPDFRAGDKSSRVSEYQKFCESCGEKIAFPPKYLGQQIDCPHCGVVILLNDPAAAAPVATPVAAAPVTAAPGEAKESFWKRFKGTIELIGAFIAIIGLGIAGWQYFKPSEEKLSAEDQYVLAHQYLEGNGTEKNVKRGGELLELAAQKDHVESMVELGMFAKEGKAGRKKDFGEALKWFELASEEGDGRALYEIGLIYLRGQGVEKDSRKAAKYFLEAAEKGNVDGQEAMASLYYYGGGKRGVVQNYDEACKWYRKASDQGNAGAQSMLGLMYASGHGVKENHVEAVKWYRKAAEQGWLNAQSNLANVYRVGRVGIERDDKQAFYWHRKAAEKNEISSQFELRQMHAYGAGVEKDFVDAYVWYHIAARPGGWDTGWVARAKNAKSSLAKQLTPEQIAKAEALAKDIIRKNPKLLKSGLFEAGGGIE